MIDGKARLLGRANRHGAAVLARANTRRDATGLKPTRHTWPERCSMGGA